MFMNASMNKKITKMCSTKTCWLSPLSAFLAFHKVSPGWLFVLKSCQISTVVAFEWVGCWMMAMHSSKQLSEIQIYTPKLSETPTEVQLCPFWESVCMCLCVCDGSAYPWVLQRHQRGVLYGLDWIYMFPSVLSLLILEIFTKWINGSQHFLKGKGIVVQRTTVRRLNWITSGRQK